MSAEDMRRLTVGALSELVATGEKRLKDLRYERPTVIAGKDGAVTAVIPGSTIEMVGALHMEIAVEIRATERAIEIVNETYRVLTSPKRAPEDVVEKKKEDIY